MKREPIELFMPPNMLKAKAGSGPGGLDMAAVKRAEQAMETLKSEFADWLADDVGGLAGAGFILACHVSCVPWRDHHRPPSWVKR